MSTHYVKIVETATGNVERRLGPMGERKAERTERGMNINLNHDKYHTEIESEGTDEAPSEESSGQANQRSPFGPGCAP